MLIKPTLYKITNRSTYVHLSTRNKCKLRYYTIHLGEPLTLLFHFGSKKIAKPSAKYDEDILPFISVH